MRNLSAITILFVFLFGFVTGCTSPLDKKGKQETHKQSAPKKEVNLTKVSTESVNQSIAQEAKKQILSMEEVEDVKAVNSDTDLYLAAKPKHHERFQLKSLRNKIKKQLKSSYPNFDIHISTDQKIFMMLDQLETKIQNKEVNKAQLKKQLKTIQSEMKSNT